MHLVLWLICAALVAALCAGHAIAQSGYPDKPIRFVVPMPPGASIDFIALAQSRPRQINFVSSGIGTAPHLAAEVLMSEAKIAMVRTSSHASTARFAGSSRPMK